MSTLPTPRYFVTQLLQSLPSVAEPSADDDARANPLAAVDDATKKQLLSLQVLFPNEYLPALDLLDRGLVTRLIIDNDAAANDRADTKQTPTTTGEHAHEAQSYTDTHTHIPTPSPLNTIYYVRSAQQRSSRYSSSYDTTQSYEVRLLAWNCSCPAFSFAAFPPSTRFDDTQGDAGSFGGVSLGSGMPAVCKHLLACVLVERCKGLFGGYVVERVVSVEEAAGWAAGWGDS